MKSEVKICLYLCLVVLLFAAGSLTVYLWIFAALCLLSVRVPFRRLRAGWIPITVFLLFTFISNIVNRHGKILGEAGPFVITDEGLSIASLKSLRILLMIMGVKIMMASSKPEEIIRGLGRLLAPFERVGVPVSDFFHTMGLTIQCFPALKDMAVETYREKVGKADAGGFWERAKLVSSFLFPMFVRSIQTPEIFFEKTEANEKQG